VIRRTLELYSEGGGELVGSKLSSLEDADNDLQELRVKDWRLKGIIRKK
jgi:hypothetical protein